MRRLVVIFTLLSVFASYFALIALPVSAAADQVCYELTETWRDDTPISASVTISIYGFNFQPNYSTTATLQPGETPQISVHGFFPANGYAPGGYAAKTDLTPVATNLFAQVNSAVYTTAVGIQDGRLNALDLGAPLAAYCSNGGIAVYDIDGSGKGTLAFLASQMQTMDALRKADTTGQNVLVAQGMGDSLYALSSNQLTLVGSDLNDPGKLYEYVTAGDACW